MKTVKINFSGFWENFIADDFLPYVILKQNYNVVISDEPDYVFCSMFGNPYEYCKYGCIRIFFSSENYSPDFNLFDYCIGFDNISYNDRYIRFPSGYMRLLQRDFIKRASEKHLDVSKDILLNKTNFCSFVYGHSANPRDYIFECISSYKKISSAGKHLNNMKDGFVADTYEKKIAFQESTKFSIAIESCSLNGFSTEKIIHSFAAKTVPIYFGDPDIAKDYNSQAFININSFETVEQAISKIIEIDNDDNLYLSMLKEPAYLYDDILTKIDTDLQNFLTNIFDQELSKAYRRPREYRAFWHNNRLRDARFYFDYYQKHELKMMNTGRKYEFYENMQKKDSFVIKIKIFVYHLIPKSIVTTMLKKRQK